MVRDIFSAVGVGGWIALLTWCFVKEIGEVWEEGMRDRMGFDSL